MIEDEINKIDIVNSQIKKSSFESSIVESNECRVLVHTQEHLKAVQRAGKAKAPVLEGVVREIDKLKKELMNGVDRGLHGLTRLRFKQKALSNEIEVSCVG